MITKGPCCPNHGVNLVDCHKGIGICPVSDARFSYESDEQEKKAKLRLNSLGQVEEVKEWNVTHLDGDGEGADAVGSW